MQSILTNGYYLKANCMAYKQKNKTNSVAFSPQANYTDWATAMHGVQTQDNFFIVTEVRILDH
jgi:hypothetical protein